MLAFVAGAVLTGYAVSFIPRNILRYSGRKPWSQWSLQRKQFVVCWIGITAGYFLAGLTLLRWPLNGWPRATLFFGLAMWCFIPVPCGIAAVNTVRWLHRLRNAWFFLAGSSCLLWAGSRWLD